MSNTRYLREYKYHVTAEYVQRCFIVFEHQVHCLKYPVSVERELLLVTS